MDIQTAHLKVFLSCQLPLQAYQIYVVRRELVRLQGMDCASGSECNYTNTTHLLHHFVRLHQFAEEGGECIAHRLRVAALNANGKCYHKYSELECQCKSYKDFEYKWKYVNAEIFVY